MSDLYTETSKFLSYVLRHEPHAIGVTLNDQGWVSISTLIEGANRAGKQLTEDLIRKIVENSDKKRFSISTDGLFIRAAQGHSNKKLSINYIEKPPPEFLYHGTAMRFVGSIKKQGLLPGERQYVHLSEDERTALAVGQRHGKPIVLKIKTLLMHQQGFKYYLADNCVWLTEEIPIEFLSFD